MYETYSSSCYSVKFKLTFKNGATFLHVRNIVNANEYLTAAAIVRLYTAIIHRCVIGSVKALWCVG